MHEGRFGYENSKEHPASESYINTTVLNALIYEYLVKKNYTGAAKVFKVEGDVNSVNITQGTSALLDWFVAFNDLYNIRSGRSKVSGIAGKIDSIMGKAPTNDAREEAQKRFNPAWYEPAKTAQSAAQRSAPRPAKDPDLLNTILEIDDAEYGRPQRYEKEGQNQLQMKEKKKLRLHLQKINTMSVCHKRKILITGGTDASICVIDLLNPQDIIKFESHTMLVSQVKVRDVPESPPDSSLHFGSVSLDREAKVYKVTKQDGKLDVSIFLNLKGHKSSVKSIDFGSTKIYTMGIDGELRMWCVEGGACLGAFALRRTIRFMFVKSDKLIGVCDSNSVSLFNPEIAKYTKEVCGKVVQSLYRTTNNTVFVFSDSVIIYDKSFYNNQVVSLPSDKIHSCCIVGGRLFLGGYMMVYEVFDKTILSTVAHEGTVSSLEGTLVNNQIMLITGSQEGELKIWEVPDRPERP